MLNLAKRVNHWVWDPNEERKRLESWHQEQERLLQVHWCKAVSLHGSQGCTRNVCHCENVICVCFFVLVFSRCCISFVCFFVSAVLKRV